VPTSSGTYRGERLVASITLDIPPLQELTFERDLAFSDSCSCV
jgi:hypothetical protein